MEKDPRIRKQRPSIFGPLILIALGIGLLVHNFGLIEGDFWQVFSKFWPVLLIIIGLDGIYRGEGMVGATFLAGLGTIFLLANFGYLSLDVWQTTLRIWPILFIAIGFDILIGRRSVVASFIGMFLILVILLGGLGLFGSIVDHDISVKGEVISQNLDDVDAVKIVFEPVAGNLIIRALTDGNFLIYGTAPSKQGVGVHQTYFREGNNATLFLQSVSNFLNIFPGSVDTWKWDLGITPSIPVNIEIFVALGNTDLDLTGLIIQSLKVNTALGKTFIKIPENSSFNAEIEGAIGQIVIEIPKGVAAYIKSDTGLANIWVPEDFLSKDKEFFSPEYEMAEVKVNIDVSMAIGNIRIIR